MESKRLGLLHELAPKVALISVLLNPNNPFFDNQLKDLNEASRALGVKIQVAQSGDPCRAIHSRPLERNFDQRPALNGLIHNAIALG
jgi:hypothetical protein